MTGTLGAHVVETMRAAHVCSIALAAVGLSAARDWRAYETFLDPYDTDSDQRGYALGYPQHSPPIPPQSCCTKTLLAIARAAGKAGDILWRRQRRDVLRIPQAAGLVGASPELARELGAQAGLLCEPGPERPTLRPGDAVLIGGDDGLPPPERIYGGPAHGLLVVGERDDGTLDVVQGGMGPGGTEIGTGHLEVYARRGGWWVRPAGSTVPGRMLRWWYPMGELPDLEGA